MFAVITFGYFLPWAIAATRQQSDTLAIGLVNFLVGWTLIGWVVACLSDAAPVQINSVAYAVPPSRTGRRAWTEHTAP